MALLPEIFYLLIVITSFIIINIIVFYVSRIKVNLTIKQRISVDDEPVIQIQSGKIEICMLSVFMTTTFQVSREELKWAEEIDYDDNHWEKSDEGFVSSFQFKYPPVNDLPPNLGAEERWQYYLSQCSVRNISEAEVEVCALDSEMFRRKRVTRNVCRSIDPSSQLPALNPRNIFAIIPRKLVWCPVYKAGSTNWMKNIPRLVSSPQEISAFMRREPKNRQVNVLARKLVPLLPYQALVRFLHSQPRPVSFIIVRHPFDRLLSAYRDKLEKFNKYYYEKYGKAIVNKYRRRGIERFGKEFYGKMRGSPVHNPLRTGKEPTFWEFITAILETGRFIDCQKIVFQVVFKSLFVISLTGLMDEHWRPMFEMCALCSPQIEYDFIIKLENLDLEQKYFVEKIEISKNIRDRLKIGCREFSVSICLKILYTFTINGLLSNSQLFLQDHFGKIKILPTTTAPVR